MWGGSGIPPRAGPGGREVSPGVRRAAGPGRRGVTARGRSRLPGGRRITGPGDVRRTCDKDLAFHDRRSIPCGLWGHAPSERGAASGRAGRGSCHQRQGPQPRGRSVIERAAPGVPGRSDEVTVRTRPGRSRRLAFGTPLSMIREHVGGHADAPIDRHRQLRPPSGAERWLTGGGREGSRRRGRKRTSDLEGSSLAMGKADDESGV